MKITESQLRNIIKESIQQEIRAYVPAFDNPEKFDGITFDEALDKARNDWFKDNEVSAKQYKDFKIIVVKQSWSTLFLIFKDDKFVTYVNESNVPDVGRFIVNFINGELQEKEPKTKSEQEEEHAYSLTESKLRNVIKESIMDLFRGEKNIDKELSYLKAKIHIKNFIRSLLKNNCVQTHFAMFGGNFAVEIDGYFYYFFEYCKEYIKKYMKEIGLEEETEKMEDDLYEFIGDCFSYKLAKLKSLKIPFWKKREMADDALKRIREF